MKAAQIVSFGSPDVLRIADVEKPHPGAGQVLVEVYGSSINPVDSAVREGRMAGALPSSLPVIGGSDVAGIVREVGDGVTNLKVGNKVYGQASILRGASGAFAEFAVVPVDKLARMPRNVTFPEAASLALAGTSAVQAIYDYIRLKAGQKILIHGGAGGIGSVAIQISRHLNAHVAATAAGEGIAFARELGAHEVIDYKTESFDTVLKEFHAVLDTIGGETFKKSFSVLRKGGIIVSLCAQPDTSLMQQYGVTAIYQHTDVDTKHLDMLSGLIEAGVVTPHIEKVFPLDEITEAFRAKESLSVRGKIAVEIRE